MKNGERVRREESQRAFRGMVSDARVEKEETPAQRGAGRAFEGVAADEDVYS
jgi:hypothetical protein